MASRGLRNNNPGNIRNSTDKFLGEVASTDTEFKQFSTMAFGYRAIFKILQTYIGRGVNTIEKMINTYAPPTENFTESYIQQVSNASAKNRSEVIGSTDYNTLTEIVKAISRVENGVDADPAAVNDAVLLVKGGRIASIAIPVMLAVSVFFF